MDIEEDLLHGLRTLGIEVGTGDGEEVLVAWNRLAAMAQRVMEFPLADDIEPAPQFLP